MEELVHVMKRTERTDLFYCTKLLNGLEKSFWYESIFETFLKCDYICAICINNDVEVWETNRLDYLISTFSISDQLFSSLWYLTSWKISSYWSHSITDSVQWCMFLNLDNWENRRGNEFDLYCWFKQTWHSEKEERVTADDLLRITLQSQICRCKSLSQNMINIRGMSG